MPVFIPPVPLLLRLWMTTGLFRLAKLLARLALWISPEIEAR